MTVRLIVAFAAIFTLCFVTVVQAATIQTTACNTDATALCATSITSLDVNGTTYDVSFANLSNSELFANNTAPFLGDISAAADARDAVTDALNTTTATFLSVDGLDWRVFLVAYNTNVDALRGGWSDTSNIWRDTGSSENIGGGIFAEFTATAVPLPASVWFIGSGLLGLMRIGRRNKEK